MHFNNSNNLNLIFYKKRKEKKRNPFIKLSKLLHISSKLGKISLTYGGGGSIIKHNITFSEEGHSPQLWVRRHSLGWGWVL
jgi:hypothetical protein